MMRMNKRVTWAALALVAMAGTSLAAGVKLTASDNVYVKLGGRIQLQYHLTDPTAGETTDELLFRRLRPYIEGSVHENWVGRFQWDMGKGEVEIKDCYFAYTGIEGMEVTIGNAKFPFSRELLTSSQYQQLVERTFVGDHNYGTPDRQGGLHLTGGLMDQTITWGASVCKAAHDPDNRRLDFDTTLSLDRGSDWSEGEMVGGRVDYHPFGLLKLSQGDFDGSLKATIGVAAFTYAGDGDGPTTNNLDACTGFEVSAALRFAGCSLDAEFNSFEAELELPGITSGMYVDSETTLQNYSIEGGYMVWPKRLELVGGYQVQDADGYQTEWKKTSVGLNWFVKKHDIKYQVTYDIGENKDGREGNDVDELFVQAQYVF